MSEKLSTFGSSILDRATEKFFYEGRDLKTIEQNWSFDPVNLKVELFFDELFRVAGLEYLNPQVSTADAFTFYFYEYDANGNRTRREQGRVPAAIKEDLFFSYNSTDQLILADSSTGPSQEQFEYDLNGNRIKDDGFTNVIGTGNRLLENKTYKFTYDANGNTETRTNKLTGKIRRYIWDAEDQLIAIEEAENASSAFEVVVEYRYGPLGRRLQKKLGTKEVNYRYFGTYLMAEVDESGTEIRRYFYDEGIDRPTGFLQDGKYYAFLKDALGSITDIYDLKLGIVVQSYAYSAFGEITVYDRTGTKVTPSEAEFKQPLTFTAREYDIESGLYYYRARYYNPSTGRFMSSDPIGFAGGDTNLYRYVNNNPVNFTDPKGTISPASVTACFVAFAAGEVFDLTSNIREQIRLQDEFEAKINALDEEKKSCSNDADRLKKEQKKQKLLDEFQRRSLGNIAGVFTPGTGGKVALGFCLLSLATF